MKNCHDMKPVNYGYAIQSNIPRTSCTMDPKPLYFSTDARYTCQPPYYQLGPQPNVQNCPYYNYTLPDTYPNTNPPSISPRAYWYLPYDIFDSIIYNQQNNNVGYIPKPG